MLLLWQKRGLVPTVHLQQPLTQVHSFTEVWVVILTRNKKSNVKNVEKTAPKKPIFFLKLGPQIPRDTGRIYPGHVTRPKYILPV